MKRSYTVDLRSTTIEDLDDEVLDAFSSAIFADRTLAGPACSADLALQVLTLRTCVDASSIDAAVAIATSAFARAAKKATLEAEVDLVESWLDVEGIADPQEVVMGGEVARRLQLSRERVRQMTESNKFPRPLMQTGRDRVWRWGDIALWAQLNERRTKVPRRKKSA